MGADGFLATQEKDWNVPHEMTFDLLLCTASADDGFDLSAYLSLLRVHGRFISVGLPEGSGWQVRPQALLANGCLIGSAHLGSRKETLEMLQLAADKGIKSWVETIPVGEKGCGEACEFPVHPTGIHLARSTFNKELKTNLPFQWSDFTTMT